MNARRLASIAGTVAVTTIAAAASYDHMRTLALSAGQPEPLAALEPFSVDGMILVATVAIGDGRRSKWSAWLAFVLGVAASLTANVLATPGGLVARVVSAWPAVALLVTVEVLARSGKAAPASEPATVATDAVPALVEAVAEPELPAEPVAAVKPAGAIVAEPAAIVASPATEPRPTVASNLTGTAAKVAAIVTARPTATATDVATELAIAPRTARRHMAAVRAATAAT